MNFDFCFIIFFFLIIQYFTYSFFSEDDKNWNKLAIKQPDRNILHLSFSCSYATLQLIFIHDLVE